MVPGEPERPSSAPWLNHLGKWTSLRWPRRQSWAKGSWWASDDSSWKKILLVDKHTLKRISKTLQFPEHYCYLKSLLKIFCSCIYSIIYSRQKYRFFRSSKNGGKLSQCRVYGLHWYSIMIQKYLAGYDEKVSGLQNPVNKGFQRKHLWKESSKHLRMRDVLSH